MEKSPIVSPEKKHIFLSYRSSEVDFALRLAVDLKNAGVNLWMDRLDIAPGDDWLKMLQKGVNDCSAMICVLSPEYVNSKYCQRELARADRMSRMIIPVLLRSVDEGDWPLEVERQQYISFTEWRDDKVYYDGVKKLISFLRERMADQVFSVPDAETRYINTLIAELEAGRGIVEYFEPTTAGGNPNREVPLRPEPIFVKTWNMRGRYALAGDTLGDDKHPASGGSKTVAVNGIYEVVESHPRLVLLGAPGSGKTTTLEHLVLDAAHLYRTAPNVAPLPVYLKLVNWEKENSPAEFIAAHWHLDGDPNKLLPKGKIALFLDGLNEMDDEGQTKVKLLRKWLHSQQAPQRIVVTCRESDYDAKLNLGIPVLRTVDLDRAHVQQFVRNYLNEDEANDFLTQLFPTVEAARAHAPQLYEMARNPFLLSALIVIYDLSSVHEIPRNTGLLLRRLVEELWKLKEKGLEGERSPFKRLEAGLVDLAFAMVDGDLHVFVPLEDALTYLGSRALLDQAVGANLLKIEDQVVRFSNHLIEEYFAALGLMRAGLTTRLSKPQFDASIQRIPSKWDMVMQILAGLSKDPDSTIQEIAKVDPYLALQCALKGVQVQEATFDKLVNDLMATMEGDRRVAVASIFIGVDDEKAHFILLQTMRDGAIWAIRLAASSAIKRIQLPLLPGLTQAIDDLEEKTREETVTALRQIGADAIPTLLQLVRDGNWHRRRGAAWALGELRDPAAVPMLLDLMLDPDYLVCAEAALALGRLKDSVAIPSLITALGHENWRVGKAASKALALFGKPAVASLLEVLLSTNTDVRPQIHALDALAQIKDSAASQALLNATYAQNVDLRSAAIEGLRHQPVDEAVKRLTECLTDTSRLRQGKRRICDIAAETLEAIGSKEAMAAVEQFRKADAKATGTFPALKKKPQGTSQGAGRGHAQESNMDPTEALKHPDWKVRRDAVLGLAALSPSVAMPRLIIAVKDEDVQVRLSTVQIMSLMKEEPRALSMLLEALGDEEYGVSDAAREALKKLAKSPFPELRERVHSTNINVRGAAIEVLGSIQDAESVPEIIECLADIRRPWLSDQRICDIAAAALQAIGTPEALKAVKQWKATLKSGAQPKPGDTAAEENPVDDQRRNILSDIITALHDADNETRQNAARSLVGYAQTVRNAADLSTIERVIGLLSEKEMSARVAGAEALAWIGNQAAIPPLIDLLKDSNWTVRIAAIRALAEIGHPSAVESLVKMLADKNEMVREATAEALGNLKDARALASLLKAITDPERFVRLAAIDALGKLKQKEAVRPLIKGLRDMDADIRWYSANALGRIGDEDAVPNLILCLADKASLSWDEKRICDVAAEALEYIGTSEAKAAVREWRQAPTPT